jgi:hypothetical protein
MPGRPLPRKLRTELSPGKNQVLRYQSLKSLVLLVSGMA